MIEKAWSVLRSRYVLCDRWIRLRSDDCLTPDGTILAPYYVTERPDFVAVFAINTYGKIILVRQYRHGLRAMSLELPGGILDAADCDPIVAARRELREETGYRGGEFRILARLGVQPASATNYAHLVLATGVDPGFASPEDGEDIELVLVSPHEARDLALSGHILNAKHVGFLLLGLAKLDTANSQSISDLYERWPTEGISEPE